MRLGPERPRDLQGSSPFGCESHRLDAPVGVPRLTGREPNPVAVGVHFWLAVVGLAIYVVSISAAGILQGAAWVAGQSFIVARR